MNRITAYENAKAYSRNLSIRQAIEKELTPIIQARRSAELSLSNRFARVRPASGYRKPYTSEVYSVGTVDRFDPIANNCPVMAMGEAMQARDAQA